MGYKRYRESNAKKFLQILALITLVTSIYFVTMLVQQRQSLSTSASVDSLTSETTASLSFSTPIPPNPQTVGSTFTTQIMVDTGGKNIFGVDATVRYDQSKLEVKSLDPVTNNGFHSHPRTRFQNNIGEINVSSNIGTGTTQAISGSAIPVATITFEVLAPITSTSLVYDFTLGNRNDSNVIPEYTDKSKKVVDILGTVTPLVITTVAEPSPSISPAPSPSPSTEPSPSPSIAPSPEPSVSPTPTPVPQSVTLLISLQGKEISELPTPPSLTLSYVSQLSTQLTTVALTIASNSTTTLDLLPSDYVFLLKSPSYLKRRYGGLTTPITISAQSAQIDFSGSPLLGGDFNNDGIINEIDYATHFLAAFASTNPDIDLDGSGQVNNLDFAIMRSNWGLIDDIIE